MLRAAVLYTVIALATAQCDTPTCYQCQKLSGCGWYTAGPLANCYQTTNVPSGLNYTMTQNGSCPVCQAGNCTDCTGSSQPAGATACAWYQNSIGVLGGKCAPSDKAPSATVGTYNKVANCPLCSVFTNCSGCTANENATSCGWYTFAGSGKCAEASPGFLWSKTSADFCSGNVCAGQTNCANCDALNRNETICAWYVPATSFLATLYNPKCDLASTGIVDTTLYNVQTGACPPCQDTTCTACQAGGTQCQWLAVNVGGTSSFGQCAVSTASIAGKTSVGTCPAACQLHSCTQCVAVSGCEWFTNSGTAASLLADSCDRISDSFTHPIATPIASAAKCPACRATRCYECNQETSNNCGWYGQTLFGKIVAGTDACYPMGKAPSLAPTYIPNTDSRCKGNPNSAAVALPGVAFLAAVLLM